MRYLVLGSSGQVGEALVNYLKSNTTCDVEEFDIVNCELQDLRTENNTFLENKIKNSDFVYFLAFDVGGSRYLSKYQHTYDFLHNNVRLMKNTFELLEKYNRKFIFASSQMSNMSYSPYGILKALGERYTESLEGLTVKFWNVYGPERDLDKSHVITDFIIKARDTGTISMLSDGNEVRQFLHVDDCSHCLLTLSNKYDIVDKNREYHVTKFSWNSIMEVAEIIASKFPGTKIVPATKGDTIQLDKRNEADEYILNFWQPKIELEEGIELVIKEMSE